MEHIDYPFVNDNVSSSTTTMQWVAATVMNNNWEMRVTCLANGIPQPPANLRIWVSSAITQDASTPMLHYISNTSLGLQVIIHFLGPVAQDLLHIVQLLAPDITQRYGLGHAAPKSSQEINNDFFPEQAHAVHYTQVGNNYWESEIAYTVWHGGYGDKSDNDAGRVAVVEAWGYFIGNTFNANKYDVLRPAISFSERQQLENQIPDDNISENFATNSSRGWIPFGMLHDMTDNGENFGFTGVNDNVNTYSIQQIFRGYQPDASTIQMFRNELLNRNGNSQATQIDQLITSYHY